jgi:hypothetical protein
MIGLITLLPLSAFFLGQGAVAPSSAPPETPLAFEVRLDTVVQSWDGVYDWAQVWAGAIPGAGQDGAPAILLTTQKENNKSDDFYLGVNTIRSDDFGKTWSGPTPHPELEPHSRDDGTIKGLCDFVSGWHPPSGKFLITGHTVYYANGRLAPRPYPRATAYASFDPKSDTWQPWQELEMPDQDKFYDAGSGMCQWVLEPDGRLLLPVYYMPKSESDKQCYSVTVLRCAFDGERLTYIEHGDELHLDVVRGLCEPSLTFYKGKYYLTLRNDVKGYVTSSEDGLHFAPLRPWTFEDGSELGSYNTMQHWATHSDGLFLVYTRRGADNDHIIRNRAPLFIARVDPGNLCVRRATERAIVPERGASLGNFGVANISENETWVTVGECMYSPECEKRGSNGSVFAARLLWSKPNKVIGSAQPLPR